MPPSALAQDHCWLHHQDEAQDRYLGSGRVIYSLRLGIVEPVFGNLKDNIGLLRFTLRGKTKVNIQWNLYGIVHNLGKIYRYGTGFT